MATSTRNVLLGAANRSTTDGGSGGFGGRRQVRVLIAEDDEALRQVIARVLADEGYAIDEAKNGFELLAMLMRAADAYDVVVSDIGMPGLTGIDVIDELRAHPTLKGASIPVILVTAFADTQTRAEADRLRALLLEKPVDMDELKDAVADLVEPTLVG